MPTEENIIAKVCAAQTMSTSKIGEYCTRSVKNVPWSSYLIKNHQNH